MVASTKFVIDSCKALDIPIICTEQYPKVFGRTMKELGVPVTPFEKYKFGMLCDEVLSALETMEQTGHREKHILLTGAEVLFFTFYFA